MKYLLVLIIIGIMALWIPHRMEQEYAKGLAEGRRTALHTNPISDELEMVCAGLWVGQENKKAYERINK